MRLSLICLLSVLALSWLAAPSFAQNEEDSPGEVHIKTNVEYCSLRVNGDEWDSHEFTDGGKTLIVKGLDRSRSNTLTLTALDDGLAPVEITVEGKEMKRKKIKKVLYFIAKRSVKFKAAPKQHAPAEKSPPAAEGKSPPAAGGK